MKRCAIASIALLLVAFAGCTSSRYAAAPEQVPPTGGFGWEQQLLQASGQGAAPQGILSPPQKALAAKQAAKSAAIAELSRQVFALRVGDGQDIGTISSQNLGLRHALERSIQQAKTANEVEVGSESYTVIVTMPAADVAEILGRHGILPDSDLPEPAGFEPHISPQL